VLKRKFNVISYEEFVCPCCGRKKVYELKENSNSYCSYKHPPREMKKHYRTEIVR
jgi:hypothetical protein